MTKSKLINFYKKDTKEWFNLIYKENVVAIIPCEKGMDVNPNLTFKTKAEMEAFINDFKTKKGLEGFEFREESEFKFDFNYNGVYEIPEEYRDGDVTVDQIKEMSDYKVLEKLFNVIASEFTDCCYTSIYLAADYYEKQRQLVSYIHFLIEVEDGDIIFFEEGNGSTKGGVYLKYHTADVLSKFDTICEKLGKIAEEEASYIINKAIYSLYEEEVFDRIISNFLEIEGNYNYCEDIKLILCKNEGKIDMGRKIDMIL